MRPSRSALLLGQLICVFGIHGEPAGAQTLTTMAPASFVRLTVNEAGTVRRHTGRVVSVTADSIHLLGSATPIALGNITQARLKVGERRHPAKGLLLGALVGATTLGVSLGGWCLTHRKEAACSGDGNSPGAAAAFGVLFGIVWGGPIGLVAGSAVKYDRWQTIPLR